MESTEDSLQLLIDPDNNDQNYTKNSENKYSSQLLNETLGNESDKHENSQPVTLRIPEPPANFGRVDRRFRNCIF